MEVRFLGKNSHNGLHNGLLDLSYYTRWLQSLTKLFFFVFTGNLSMSIYAMMAAAGSQVLKARWSKELNDNYIAAICNTEEEIVYVNVRLNQVIRQRFPEYQNFHRPG